MSETLKFGNGLWATKVGSTLAYNDENGNFKPLPFNFTRATSATRVNKAGLIETVGSGEPRIDFLDSSEGALLLEPTRSNLILYSEALSNTLIKSGTYTDNFAISPDGTQNATKLTATNADPYFYQNLTFLSSSYTVSIYIKGIGSSIGKDFEIRLAGNIYTDVIPSEWTRFEYTQTISSGNASVGLEIPNPAVIGDELLVWGFQLEQGNATSYIPTQGSIGTRVAEVCNGAGNEQVFNDSEGVLFANWKSSEEDSVYKILTIKNPSDIDNRVVLFYYEDTIQFEIRNPTGNFTGSATVENVTNLNKVALKYKSGNTELWFNGIKLISKSNAFSLNGLDDISFDYGNGLYPFYGETKQIQYFNQALTDAELISLTKK